MKRKTLVKEESALRESEKWKIMQWMWDNLGKCPDIDHVTDVAAVEGTMSFLTPGGNEYTLTIKKGNWREI